MMSDTWEIYALKYATRSAERVRTDSYLFDDHTVPHVIDYYLWALRRGDEVVVIDTGYDAAEGAARGRPVLEDPGICLQQFGIDPEAVQTVILTHLHYDHAGALSRFPNATFHIQAAEMAFATGPCMCHDALRFPFTAEHVCEMVRHIYSGRVIFHDGDAEVAPGLEVAAMGGHSRGLQSVRVKTGIGWVVLASDASHFYENWRAGKLFPIVIEAEAMVKAFARLPKLATRDDFIVPGHDPLVRQYYPLVAGSADGAAVHRLDVEPDAGLKTYLESLTP